MTDMTFTPKQAVYKVQGSIAALVKEEVWERLLKGEVVGVMEPDHYKFSLFINGQFVKPITAHNERRLEIKAERAVRAWQSVQGHIAQDIDIQPGYPNFLSLPHEKVKLYAEKKFDARRCAEWTREFIKRSCGKLDSLTGVFSFMDEIDRGMTREGRD